MERRLVIHQLLRLPGRLDRRLERPGGGNLLSQRLRLEDRQLVLDVGERAPGSETSPRQDLR